MHKLIAVLFVLYLVVTTAHIRRNSGARKRRGVTFSY